MSIEKSPEKLSEIFLAAFDLAPAERARFLAEHCDEQNRREVESLFEAHAAAGSFLENVSAVSVMQQFYGEGAPLENRQIGHFRLLRELGCGGMGVVYLAEREDFHQQAALKIIKRGMDSDAILERFKREREILAALSHPFIARLLDGGTTAEGTPFFAMEYVEGLPLDEYCRSAGLSLNERLALFRKICEAVSFAHQKLIIHRDLKPSNILVAADGTPKLLDFGIAKLLNAETGDETQTRQRVLTPAYASPEQMRGEQVDTTSDVYSLGKILSEITGLAVGTSPDTPRQTARRGGNTDLRAILQTAMREERTGRYNSVEKFSEDIRRHLAGLPVLAHKDSFAYRASKFFKRNRLAASAAAAVAVTLIGGIAATSWEAHLARLERSRAERRFDEIRQITDSFMFELNDELQKGPTKARAMLVKKAIEYLDSLAAEAGGDAGLQRELAVAYMKLGDIQSKPFASNLGDTAGALESYEKAAALLGPLVSVETADAENLRLLSNAEEGLGSRQSLINDHEAAIANQQKALEIRRRLVALDPGSAVDRRLLGASYQHLGDALSAKNKTSPDEALPPQIMDNYRQALALDEALAAGGSQTDIYKTAVLHQRLATRYVLASENSGDTGLRRLVLAEREKALDACRRLVEAEPANPQYQRCFVAMTADITAVKFDLHEDAHTALENYVAAVAQYRKLSDADPANLEMRRDLAQIDQTLVDLYEKKGENKEAAGTELKVIEIFESLQKTDAARLNDTRPDLSRAYRTMADLLRKSGELNEALEYRRKASLLDSAKQPEQHGES